nr:hypothetical protein [uncultured Novosphingobium sp.]
MIRKYVIAGFMIGFCCAASAQAQVSNTYNPNFVFQQTLPVLTSPCKGGICSRSEGTQREPVRGSNANTRATCANARKMTPRPSDRAKMDRLLKLCEDAGY